MTVAFGLVAADDPQREEVEIGKFQGNWTITTLERGGKDLTKTPQFQSPDVVIEGDQFRTKGIEATLKLDPSQSPKALDFSYHKGPFAGQTIKAIYKLEGDTLTIIRANAEGDERPTEFSAPAETGKVLAVLKRGKAAGGNGQ
jgi:uncharacterized protein (TIGR03067 family)